MRVVQVIDSLDTGGAERMAVNYANALAAKIEFSGLVATRAEGKLLKDIQPNVGYLFLKKRSALDPFAVYRLRKYCIANRIDIIHAHSTSYFLALQVKLFLPRIKIIWHDHNGNSEFLEVREAIPLNVCSFFFKGIIVVNDQLRIWAVRELHCPHVLYIPNFSHADEPDTQLTDLHGLPGKRILHLANLREQKNHFFLLKVAQIINQLHPEWTFHLVGKDFEDDYSAKIFQKIKEKHLDNIVFVYGSRSDTAAIIKQADITILTSKSEGLPVALLEYAMHAKPVIATLVGEIPFIIDSGRNGFGIDPSNPDEFADKLSVLIENEPLRNEFAQKLHGLIMEKYAEEAAISSYLRWVEKL